MSKIEAAFADKKCFVAFLTGGDPDIETTEKLIPAMEEAGVDIIEIGIPFSDPVAEGEVIQKADERALANGCTTDKLFDMVKRVREKVKIPLLFMTYYNPVYTYGNERFLKKCTECGIDGIIVPDLPYEEKGELSELCVEYGIDFISMITPASAERIAKIAKEARGFLYCVSSLGVTGVREKIGGGVGEMIKEAKKNTSVPCAVGFGISTPEQAKEICTVADGFIIGSAIVKIIAEHGRDSVEKVKKYIVSIQTSETA